MPRQFTDVELRVARVALQWCMEEFAEHGWDALDRVSVSGHAAQLKFFELWPTLSIAESR